MAKSIAALAPRAALGACAGMDDGVNNVWHAAAQ
jgi:hypothetical protein